MSIEKLILEQWLKLCEATDEAPWFPVIATQPDFGETWTGRIEVGFPGTPTYSSWIVKETADKQDIANIRFMCAARTAMPMLIQEVRDLQKLLREEKKAKNDTE